MILTRPFSKSPELGSQFATVVSDENFREGRGEARRDRKTKKRAKSGL